MRIEELGGLKVRIVGGTDGQGGGSGPVVILLHGFGAPGHDLVPLWKALDVLQGTRFLFPEAPLSLDMGFGDARAWWMLDLARINHKIANGRLQDLSKETPKGLPEAREQLISLLEQVEKRLDADPRKTVLGGFSQGAMLACDTALRTDRPLAGLILLSGSLLAQEEWVRRMPKRQRLPVLQSHGHEDPILPFFLAEQLHDLLSQAGLPIEWVDFQGGHEIPPIVLDRVGAFLNHVTAS